VRTLQSVKKGIAMLDERHEPPLDEHEASPVMDLAADEEGEPESAVR